MPGNDVFNGHALAHQFVGREIPVGITDSDGYRYPPGFGYPQNLSRYIRVVDRHTLDTGTKAVLQSSEADGLSEKTDIKLGARFGPGLIRKWFKGTYKT